MEKNEENEKSRKSGMQQRNSRYTQSIQSFQTAARILDSLGIPKHITQHSTDKPPPLLKNLQRLPMAHGAKFNPRFCTWTLRLSMSNHHLHFRLLATRHLHASALARSPPSDRRFHPLPYITACFFPFLFP